MEDNISAYLYSLRGRGAKLGLERVQRLAEALGSPQKEFKSVVVGGTSGKGSTAAMLSSILKQAGFRVGTFTSPHLSSLTERIAVNGEAIGEKKLEEIIGKIKAAIEKMEGEHPTFFEVITAAAFCYFREKKVDFAVLEVGLGGRLDATNITAPVVSVITNVSLEHTRVLGDTIEKIAKEKAGIIQSNGILVTAAEGTALEVFENTCKERGSAIIRVGKDISFKGLESGIKGQRCTITIPEKSYEVSMPLLGRHQLLNAACALGALYALERQGTAIPENAVKEGLSKVVWPGRMEIVQEKPLVVLDCAKDAEAMKSIRETISGIKHQKLIVVLSISSDKDIKSMVDEIVPASDVVVIAEHRVMERAADAAVIENEVKKHSKEHLIIKDVKAAAKKALSLADENDMVLITGSLFTVAEARELWHKEKKKKWGKEFNESVNNLKLGIVV